MIRREDQLAKAVADFIRVAAPDLLWWHVRNEGNRNGKWGMIDGKRGKEMGVRPGVSDLNFILPDGRAAFIELKTESNKLSKAQQAFAEEVIERNCPFATCRSVDDVRVTLEEWGVPLRVSAHNMWDGR